jgi:hypothetical protein
MKPLAKSLEFCRRALESRESFWAEQANAIHWRKPLTKVCDYSHPPFARWFVGGETNLCYNAVDRHLESRGNQPVLSIIFPRKSMSSDPIHSTNSTRRYAILLLSEPRMH